MGYKYNEFWEMNPRILEPILKGYKLKRKIIDEENWILGGYVFEAVSLSLQNAFRKKTQKAKSYFEVVKNPFLNNVNTKELSEEEKQRQREKIMAGLKIMQINFNNSRGK